MPLSGPLSGPLDRMLNNMSRVRVCLSNITQWQRRILQHYYFQDNRFEVIDISYCSSLVNKSDRDNIHLRLVGFDSSRPGDNDIFAKHLNDSPNVPTIALIASPQVNAVCELPSQIRNRVLIPSSPDSDVLSVTQFYVALNNATQHAVPTLQTDTVYAKNVGPSSTNIEVLAIGASTGGPKALQVLLNSLPSNLQTPIVIAQHMPATFTASLARQLDQNTTLQVREAQHHETLQGGHVYIAPGNRHMTLKRVNAHEVCVELDDTCPVNSCRPSVDVLFESAALVYGSSCMGVVLTGMGIDGLAGSSKLSNCGAMIYVQDESCSVVWGMPGSIVSAGLANDIVHIDEMGCRLAMMLESRSIA